MADAWDNLATKNTGETVAAADVNTLMENIRVLGGNGTSAPSTDIESIYPVGCFYTQYPAADSSTELTAFPTAYRPAALFGNTWTAQWETEYIFFRTLGEAETRTDGLQGDAMQRITGQISAIHTFVTFPALTRDGVFDSSPTANIAIPSGATSTGKQMNPKFDNADSVSPNAAKTSDTETRSKNRLMKIWKRTA